MRRSSHDCCFWPRIHTRGCLGAQGLSSYRLRTCCSPSDTSEGKSSEAADLEIDCGPTSAPWVGCWGCWVGLRGHDGKSCGQLGVADGLGLAVGGGVLQDAVSMDRDRGA